MALFAQRFGQTSSNYQPNYHQEEGGYFEGKIPVASSSGAMKRRNVENADEPGAKRRHYEDRMAFRLNSLDLSGQYQQQQRQESYSDDDDFIVEEIDPEVLTETPQQIDDDDDEPIVEEPEEELDEDIDSGFVIHDDIRNFWKRSNHDHILDKMVPKTTGRELVLWRPPPIKPQIEELQDGDVEISEYREPIPLPFTQQQIDETRFLQNPGGTVTFPMDESASSSARSSSSPPMGAKGYSSSSSSCDINVQFRFRPIPKTANNTNVPPPVNEEPMDLD